ncbi:family 16 glycosylhydrolase [Pelagicoccus sp. SDUM812003]|uniref:family 16 glycosylhydrolase n=1 Tax=Pelagicoccus sp. SDUM812003 TaxID=3041267 RepID=UPI00280F54A9|nr:family 16 glycosylhydrolase [Pelagicoccus sp. SDUM812003]MDQ8201430.1 family 16 glycosylhydrolase [Pelagicoccus sp. SDUM812003]
MSRFELAWEDEFDYPDEELDERWISQNGPTENEWVLCSRWRDNAVVKDGVLHLEARKESRGGQDWTAASIWTKDQFGYGYYECRYKYAGAYGTNNSFWLWPKQGVPEGEKACEIDINEGHYPHIINTNVHNWTDTIELENGKKIHEDNQLHHTLLGEPVHSIELDHPVKAKAVRLRSSNPASIHIRDLRILGPANAYPEVGTVGNEANLAVEVGAKLTTSGSFSGTYFAPIDGKVSYAVDGDPTTAWVSNKHQEKWIQVDFGKPRKVGAVQFLNGWVQEDGATRNLMSDYVLEYQTSGGKWKKLVRYDASVLGDYAEEFHTYGLHWTEERMDFYLDGKLFHSQENKVCFSETTILLSLALLKADIAGPITDAIDGKSMKVDFVRYYQERGE